MTVHRAWAQLELKAFDPERRTITGIASTPEPDRRGDIVEPAGVTFSNPIPLLLHHDQTLPVGTATLTRQRDAITFEASLPLLEEPPALKARVQEACAAMQAGFIRGVSIGFRALEDGVEFIKGGGMRFTKTEIVELSLVTVPAHAGATIHTIKAFDTAALGHHPPGVTGLPVVYASKDAPAMTLQERITGFEHTRAARVAALEAIQKKALDEGRTKDDAEKEQFQAEQRAIEAIDGELADLRKMEVLLVTKATPILARTPEEASAVRSGVPAPIVTVRKQHAPGIEFSRYVICCSAARGNLPQALEIAKARYPDEDRIHLVLKAAVAAGTTTDATWAGSLVAYTDFAGDFIEYLRPRTIVGKFGQDGIPDATRVPFNVRIIGQTSGGAAYWVGQGKPKPLTKYDFTPTTLGWAKVATISVLTDELVRFSSPNAETLVRNALAGSIAARIDIDFVDPAKAAVANVSPASITNGVAPIVSDGTDAAAIIKDVTAAMNTFVAANIDVSGLVWIMSATTALRLSLMTSADGTRLYPDLTLGGGRFMGLPVITSQYVGTNVVLVHAPDILLAEDQLVIDASREASLEMSDAPTNDSVTGVGASLVSMFQTNSVALRAERFINWGKRRAAAVSLITDVDWGGTETP